MKWLYKCGMWINSAAAPQQPHPPPPPPPPAPHPGQNGLFRRRYFPMHIREWEVLCFDYRRQAFILTNADLIHWCIYSALGGDKLNGGFQLLYVKWSDKPWLAGNGTDKQRVLMHGHQGWNVRHGLCHIYMIYVYIWVVYSFCLFCCLFIIVTTQFVALYKPCKPKPKFR